MNVGGYTGIPDTLEEAQAMIVRLLDGIKAADKSHAVTLRTLDRAVEMIEKARLALNAAEGE
jgi:hypothetical protein